MIGFIDAIVSHPLFGPGAVASFVIAAVGISYKLGVRLQEKREQRSDTKAVMRYVVEAHRASHDDIAAIKDEINGEYNDVRQECPLCSGGIDALDVAFGDDE